jgi:hypothetical protein
MSRNKSLEQVRQESLRVWSDAQRRALHEAVKNTPVAPPAVAAAASGTGSGGSFSAAAFYAYGSPFEEPTNPGIFQSIDAAGNLTQIGTEMFIGPTVFCRNTDNGNMYYISQDTVEEEMVVGIVDTSTGVQTELNRIAVTALNYSAPSSLVYIGNDSFIYLANGIVYTFGPTETQEIIEIQIVGNVVTAVYVSEYTPAGAVLTGIFQWNNEWWVTAVADGAPLALLSSFDIEAGTLISGELLALTNYPFSQMYKFGITWGLSQAPEGKIYVIGIVVEKDNGDYNRLIIAELDPENYTASYVETVNYVLDDTYIPVDIEIA